MINPYDLDPIEARHRFADFLDDLSQRIYNEMYDIQDDLQYILYHYYHEYDFENVGQEVLAYLVKNGLKEQLRESKPKDKANPDYYLALYFGLETAEYFFSHHQSMELDTQLNDLKYANSQLAIVKALMPDGEPKHKVKNTTGQSKGASIANRNKYKFSRQRAIIEWNKYKKSIKNWENYKSNSELYEREINLTLKNFEQLFFNSIVAMRLKNLSLEDQNLLNERYTDSTQNPPLAIGWIKEMENILDKAVYKRKRRKLHELLKNNPFSHIGIRGK